MVTMMKSPDKTPKMIPKNSPKLFLIQFAMPPVFIFDSFGLVKFGLLQLKRKRKEKKVKQVKQ